MTLRELRKARNLTQEDVAKRAGMRPSQVGSLERGEYPNVEINTLRKIAHALGYPLTKVVSAFDETTEAA